MAFTVPECMYLNLASGFYNYRSAVTGIYTSSTPVLFSAECLPFCPKVLIHLITRGSCQPSVSHSVILHSGWQAHSQPSSMSGCTYSMCSAFYLPTDRPLPCENIFLHGTGNCATSPCKTAAPAKYSYQSSVIWLHLAAW